MRLHMTENTPTARLWKGPRIPVGRWGLTTGAVIIGLIAIVAILAPWIAPHSPYEQSLTDRLIRPVFMEGGNWNHILGTDHLGRDYLSRLVYGARLSIIIGFGTILLSAVMGIGLGLLGGFFGGRIDMAVMFLLTVRLSLPIMLAAISLVGLLGNSLPLMMLILACFLWDQFLVVTRSLTMRYRNAEFVLAARAAGLSNFRIMTGEILPNLVSPLIVVGTLEMAHAILLEAALSFLGLGIRPPDSSWGLMIAEAKDFVFFESWLVNIPGLAIFVLVVGITFLGEGLRSLLAPDASQ
ncbi:ABC transporter permease [Agrobacterium sp. AGB01]|uniref:ABC transporter permease n=1 Tax=Agrobacterium sp. AGB01 TaxID=2769302 RepID=UPI00177B9289|nr:ABC transporter permease [Agrobacterium sp. AGB01]MBD9388953.1 ABC transporter permease [Agrobacterium sp. AGB01]